MTVFGSAQIFPTTFHALTRKHLTTEPGELALEYAAISRFLRNTEGLAPASKKGRFVQILYVYQDPVLAWQFVLEREKLEGRRILPETFVSQYFGARMAVNSIKSAFGKQITVDLLLKNRDNSPKVYKANIDRIDNHVPERYTEDDVLNIIGKIGTT